MLRLISGGAVLAIVLAAVPGAGREAPEMPLRLRWEKNLLTIRGPRLPGEVEINYLEAYCRPGSTDRDWKETVIPHRAELLEASDDGTRIRLRDTLADGVVVDHTITATADAVDFRLTATNPAATASQAHWAQPCVRVDRFTGVPRVSSGEAYLPQCFVFIDGRQERMPTRSWATKARYTPGQVWCPKNVSRDDVNPRPLNPKVPSNGLIGCYSRDGRQILAMAWEPYQELFQGVICCLHSDFRLGGLKPAETKRIRGKIYLVDADLPALLSRYRRDFPEHHVSLEGAFRPRAPLAGDLGRYRSPLVFADGSRVKNAGDWKRRRDEIRRAWTELMGAWPPPVTPAFEVRGEARRENFLQQRVRLEVAPGRRTDGYLLIPEGTGPRPAVLIVYYEPETAIGQGAELRDFGLQLARRGFVVLSIGSPYDGNYYPSEAKAELQPLSFLAYAAANARRALASLPQVDPRRIGVLGHSYGGKWAMFAACLDDGFAAGAWSDPGIVFDESRPNVNYWEPWYLGYEPGLKRERGVPGEKNPRTGAYRRMVESGRDLHELLALMPPRPFLVSGGSEDPPERWRALNHVMAVNDLLDSRDRVAFTSRSGHTPTPESNEQVYLFFERFLGGS